VSPSSEAALAILGFMRARTGTSIGQAGDEPSVAFYPTAEFTGGYGNYNTKTASFYGSMPISSTLSANLALYGSDESSGWGRNFTTGNPTYVAYGYGGRTKVLWSPDEATEVKLTLTPCRWRYGRGSQPETGQAAPQPLTSRRSASIVPMTIASSRLSHPEAKRLAPRCAVQLPASRSPHPSNQCCVRFSHS
jgi:hypothetical protein